MWGQPSEAQQTILMSATTCRQLPALLTSVSNSIAGSVLPPSLGRGGVSLAEGATHHWTTCFFPLSGVRHLILQWRLTTGRLAFSPFPGCDTLSCNDDSPLGDLVFLLFRGATPYLAMATHHWATCFFPVSGVRHLILLWRLTTG